MTLDEPVSEIVDYLLKSNGMSQISTRILTKLIIEVKNCVSEPKYSRSDLTLTIDNFRNSRPKLYTQLISLLEGGDI